MRKITVNDLKVGDMFAQEDECLCLYPFVVTHIDVISGDDRLLRVTFDWIDIDGEYSQDCVVVLAKDAEIYRFII
jgi:hypothetical protein